MAQFVDAHKLRIEGQLTLGWETSDYVPTTNTSSVADKIDVLYSSADLKFTNSGVGNSLGINPKYQWCRYSDPRRKGLSGSAVEVRTNNTIAKDVGMGEWFSKSIDDNAQMLTMEFGVPDFISPFSVFSRAISYPMSVRVNQGREPLLYHLANGISSVAFIIALPYIAIPLMLIKGADAVINGATDYRYYTMKPDNYAYWDTVNTLVNYMATARGVIKPELGNSVPNRVGTTVTVNQDYINLVNEMTGGIIGEDGFVDCFQLANRAALRHSRMTRSRIIAIEDGDEESMREAFKGTIPNPNDGKSMTDSRKDLGQNEMYIEQKTEVKDKSAALSGEAAISKDELDDHDDRGRGRRIPGSDDRIKDKEVNSFFYNVMEYYTAIAGAGGGYARLYVEHTGEKSINFTNTLKNMPMEDAFNGISGASRDARFMTSGGALFGDFVEGVKNQFVDVIAGTANGITGGLSNVILGLLGGGYLELGKMWEDSNVDVTTHSFKIVIDLPYNNPLTQLVKQDIPMAMVLAGGLPRATGEASYGSPFLCSAFMKGVIDTDKAMITNINVSYGTGNIPMTPEGVPLGSVITFDITDLSNIMSAPTNAGLLSVFTMSLDETKPLNRFMNVLGGRDFYSSRYIKPKALLRLALLKKGMSELANPNRIALAASNGIVGQVSHAFMSTVILPD